MPISFLLYPQVKCTTAFCVTGRRRVKVAKNGGLCYTTLMKSMYEKRRKT